MPTTELTHEPQAERVLRLLRALAVVLIGGALVILAGALSASAASVDVFAALALAIAAAASWRIADRASKVLDDSQAWTRVADLRSLLAESEALWTATPAPLAVWSSQGRLLRASAAWSTLGFASEAPLDQLEVPVGDPARTFVAESAVLADGGRLVLLREVTREREALRAKDDLLAIVGHELRTPLSSIKGYGQLMARQLATVQEQVQRLDQLIGDVLDTSRAERGQLMLRRQAIAVDELIQSAAESFRLSHPLRRLDLDVDTCPLIEGDPSRLSQVLDNLLSNAAKYSPPETAITLRAFAEGAWVRIAVIDDGVGIAREHLPRLFERFYRVPVPDSVGPPGFGLGLSIVHDLVEAHGGSVEVVSDGPGTGCTFRVMLPSALPVSAASDRVLSKLPT